jgi:hypothetical protein
MKRGVVDPQVLNDLLTFTSKRATDSTLPGPALLGSNRSAIALQLRSYGEDAIALAVEAASPETIWAIPKRGGQLMFSSGESIPRSLCLATVELIEGAARPLARKRRRHASNNRLERP